MPSDSPEIEELNKKAEILFKNKKINDLLPRMDQMFKKGLLYKDTKDYSNAYILLTRFVNTYNFIYNHKEYKLAPNKYKLPSRTLLKDAISSLEYIVDCINRKNTVNSSLNNEKLINNGNTDDNEILNLPETPTDEPIIDKTDGFIMCNEFYKIIKDTGLKYLIIDVRPKDDFNTSKILSPRAINIDENYIKQGMIPSKFEIILRSDNHDHYELFLKRSKKWTDKLILLDWSTNKDNITKDKKISIMKNILENWDQEIPANILILNGGYSELLLTFPMILTNPNVSAPNNEINHFSEEILDGTSYPEWMIDIDKSKTITNNNNSNNEIKKKSTNIYDNFMSDESNDYKNIIKLDNDNSIGVHKLSQEMTKVVIKNSDKTIPIIPDRSIKPVTIIDREYGISLIKTMEELLEFTKKHQKLENQICNLEDKLYSCLTTNERHPYDDDAESLRPQIIAVQETIDNILKDKILLQHKLEELHKLNKTISKGDAKMIDSLSLNINSSELALQMAMKDREQNKQKFIKAENSKQKYVNLQLNNDHQIHMEPLKLDGSTNSGLKRSLSSPNLAKTESIRKIPTIDRSTKPPPSLNETNNIRRSPWKDRTINMDPVYRNVNPGITGLKNLGNSCYMNSIIQCLSNTTYLTKYLNNGGYQEDLNTGNDNETQGRIAEEFAQVIRALWRGQYRSIAPRDLKDTIGQFRQQFHSHEQQDSHEFLTFFLEWMHNDLKKDEKLKIENNKITPAEKAWDKELKGQYSIISKLFIGQFRSTIQCQICHKKSITYETFSSLSISLPDSNRCTLDDCIERFLRAQEVQGWTCPNCKTNRDATKKFDFVKLPPILIVHLNRFAGTTMKLEKKNTYVTFPVDNFNLENFLVYDDDNKFNHTNSYTYNLYGLSNHYGSMDGGHYTAYCKNSQLDKWYKFDDQTVTEIQKNEVKSQNTSAYLLFYTSYASHHTASYIDR